MLFRSLRKNRETVCLGCLLACGFLLRLFAASDLYLHDWDERYHALVAKHVMQHPFRPMLYVEPLLPYDYREWIGNHVWVHKEPLSLWLIATSFAIFGINEIALRLPSVLLSTAAVGAVFLMARQLLSAQAGFVAAGLFAINGFLIELVAGRAATDHVDTLFI